MTESGPPARLPERFGRLSLRVRLLLLMALALAPAIVASTITAVTRYEAGVGETRANLRALSLLAVNRHLETLAETNRLLQTVAKLPEIMTQDGQQCSAVLARLHGELSYRYTNIAVVGRDGIIRCSALPMEPGRRYSIPDQLQAVLERKAFVVGGITVGGFTGERLLSAAAPIVDADGRPTAAVATGIRADFLDSRFDAFQLPKGSQLALVDRNGQPLVEHGSESWRLPSPDTLLAALRSGQREFQHVAGGQSYLVVINPIGAYDMFALAALPADVAISAVTWRLVTDMAEILAFALLAALGVLIGAQLLVLAPIARFRSAVRAYAQDRRGFAFDSARAPPEIIELAGEFANMAHDVEARQQNMSALLRQRDLLVRETNHRVKNNLQIVASLLSLQSRRITEPGTKAQFDLARQRVGTLALLHRHLYEQHDTETVNLRNFFGQLMLQLAAGLGHRAQSTVNVADLRVPPSIAIPLGLIVTEAVTNAMKYAFPDGRQGHIDLSISVSDGRGRLVLSDDGVGSTRTDGAATERAGMGDVLMRGFAEQISGTLVVDEPAGGGTRITLDFQLEEPSERDSPPDDQILEP